MPVQHSPPAKNTRSQRHQAFLTPTARAALDRTPKFHQLSANLDRGPPMEGAAPSRRGGVKSRLEEAEDKEGEESVEEEESEETEVAAALAGAPEASEAPNLALSNQPLVSQAEPNFLKMMEQMTQFMGQLTQAVAPRDTSKAPAFKTPSMKAPDSFDGTKAYKLRGFIQSCQLIFHNDPENFFCDRKKGFTKLFFLLLFTLFGDPNEVRKAEQELDNLRMKESGQVSLYIADFRSLMSRIGDWGEGPIFILQELMDTTLELDNRYHERKNEKGTHQGQKPPISGSNSSKPPQSSSS
ncbi:hypothetical protein O181_037418 [Austropuccinia psidii MF-1]|uniref:Retrotransposon gag domain-containing protein n=1 Tax=Austropuccinia psidii MF-1 TaxID=1389203 RepID=A0A9Q3D9C8_9BASI|nr:hypothetical protein [Austropuccinia psidii MF-1]